jgi:anti-sigma B factor antagonist
MTGPADGTGSIPQPFVVAAHAALPGVFLLRGELDLAGAPTLTWALSHVEGAMGDRVVLDVSDLSFIDASGVRAVSNAHARLQRRGAEVIVRHPQPPVRRAFGLCGFDARLEPSDEATLHSQAENLMGTGGVEPPRRMPFSGV